MGCPFPFNKYRHLYQQYHQDTRLKLEVFIKKVLSTTETVESKYDSEMHIIQYLWVLLYASNNENLLWANKLMTFQR